jgi:nicotinate-nucleotide adenylyltransferase
LLLRAGLGYEKFFRVFEKIFKGLHSLPVNCSMLKRKIALFGGTFDPVHLGHTTVAAEAVEQIGAEKIVFVPAKRSPLKMLLPEATDKQRFEMMALAIADNKRFELSDYELRQSRQSYTLQTVRKFQADYGGDILIYWLVGADTIGELPHWYKITELIDSCFISVMYRAGFQAPDFSGLEPVIGHERVEKLQRSVIKTSLVDISSTRIRKDLAAGRDVTDMLNPNVADYIYKYGLYGSTHKP